jgi:hypothetical protein
VELGEAASGASGVELGEVAAAEGADADGGGAEWGSWTASERWAIGWGSS